MEVACFRNFNFGEEEGEEKKGGGRKEGESSHRKEKRRKLFPNGTPPSLLLLLLHYLWLSLCTGEREREREEREHSSCLLPASLPPPPSCLPRATTEAKSVKVGEVDYYPFLLLFNGHIFLNILLSLITRFRKQLIKPA